MKFHVAMKKIVAVMLIFAMVVQLVPAYAVEGSEPVDEQYPKGTINLEDTTYEASENEGSFRVKISRQRGSQGAVDVDVHILQLSASLGDDFTIEGLDSSLADEKEFTFAGTVHFQDGEYYKTFDIDFIDDDVSEGTENFMLALLDPSEGAKLGLNASTTFNILDDEPEEFSAISFKDPQIVTDSDMGEVSLDVVRTGGDYRMVTVAYSVYSADDQKLFSYPVEGNLIFMPYEIEKTITVPLQFNDDVSGRVNFDIVLSDCKGGHLGKFPKTSVTVLGVLNSEIEEKIDVKSNPFAAIIGSVEEESVKLPYIDFNRDTYYANYGNGSVEISLVREGDIKSESSVLVKTAENTAVSGIDYQPVSEYLTFEPGEREKIVNIPLMATDTGDSKSFYVYMAYPEGAQVEDNNRAEVILSPGTMIRMAASSSVDDSLFYPIPIDETRWKNGVKGKHTETSIKDGSLTLKTLDKGWFSSWHPENYDVSIVTSESYGLTGYESIVVEWSKTGDSHARVFISDKSNGNRGEDVLSYKHKENFSGTDEYSIDFTESRFIRFNLAGDENSSTMKVKSVKLKKRTYKLKTVSTNEGTIDTGDIDTAYLGRVVKVVAHPAPGYELEGFKLSKNGRVRQTTGKNIGSFKVDQDLLIQEGINNNADITIIPVFKLIKVPVEVKESNGGDVLYNGQSISGETISDVLYNKTIQLKAVPDEGKYFAGWNITGFDGAISDNPVNLTLLDEDYSVVANFGDKRILTINTKGNSHGSVQADKDGYKAGEIAVLTAIPDKGYQAEWTLGSYKYVGNVFFLQMDTDKTVNVEFIEKQTEQTKYHTIAGKIVDEDGRGVPNMKVMLPSGVNGISEAVTNSNGEYSFSKVYEYQHDILIATYDQSGKSGRVAIVEKNISNYVEKLGDQKVVELPNITAHISQSSLLPIRVQEANAYIASDLGEQKVTTVEINKDINITVDTSVAWNGSEPGFVNFMIRDYEGNIKNTIAVDASKLENPSHIVVSLNVDELFSQNDELIVQAVSINDWASDIYVTDVKATSSPETPDLNDTLDISDEMPLPPDMPLFKAIPEVEVGNMSTSFTYEDGVFILYLGVGTTIVDNSDGLQKPEDIKNFLLDDGIQKLGDALDGLKSANYKSGAELGIDVALGGKFIWAYNQAKSTEEDGNWDFAGGFAVINGAASVKKVFYFLPLGFPLYISLQAELSVDLTLGSENDPNDEKGWAFQGEIDPVLEGRAAGGVGVEGIFAGEAWLKAFIEGEAKFGRESDFDLTLGASLGLAGTMFGIFGGEWPIWEKTYPKEEKGEQKQSLMTLMRAGNQTVSDAIYSQTQSITLKPINRDYLKKQTVMTESPGMPKMKAFSSTSFIPVEDYPLITSTYPGSDPHIVKFDDKIMAVYIIDRGNKNNRANCPMAVYTLYKWDKENSKYELLGEKYNALNDDGTMDQNPYVYETEKSVVVAWVSADTIFNDNVTIQEINSSYEIQAKFYDKQTGTWSGVHQITDDDFNYNDKFNDSIPRIASYYDSANDKEWIMIAYQKMEYLDNADVESGNMNNKILLAYRLWDGEKWSKELGIEVPHTTEDEPLTKYKIPTMDMISYDGMGILTYMLDGDGDTETNDDQEIYMHYFGFPNVLEDKPEGGWTEPIRMTVNDWMDKNPKVGLAGNDKSYLFWYSGDKIVYYHLKELYEHGFENVTDKEGNKIWVLKDDFPPYTAYIDDTVYKDNPYGGEMQNFNFTVGEDGNVYILWAEFSEQASNIYMSACGAVTNDSVDGESTSELGVDGLWSKKYKITDNNSINRSFDAVVTEDGKVWIIYNKVSANLDEMKNSGWEYKRTQTDLYLSVFEPFSDFDVEIEVKNALPFMFSYSKKPGPVRVKVTNTGIWKINDPIEVTLSGYGKGGEEVFKETKTVNPPIKSDDPSITPTYPPIAGGETAKVIFKVPIKGVRKLKASAVKVSKEEASAGIMKMSLLAEEPAKTDEYEIPSLPLINVSRKEPVFKDGKYTFGALVTNDGIATAKDTKITLNIVDPKYDLLNVMQSVYIPEISSGVYEDIDFKPIEIGEDMFDSFNIAHVVIKAASGEDSSECEIILNNSQEDTKTARNIFIDKTMISMSTGQIEKLNASLYPTTATSELKWSSSNPEVVAVTQGSGFISAISPGEAIITVTALPEGITKECTVKVQPTNSTSSSKTRKAKKDEKDEKDKKDTSVILEEGIKKTVVDVDTDKMEELLSTEGEKVVLSVKNESGTDAVRANFDVETIKMIKEKEALLSFETEEASYNIPAKAIDFEAVLGDDIENASVSVEITPMAEDEAVKLQKDVENDGYTIVAPPVRFEIKCNVGEKNFNIDKFSSYVERRIAIPDGIDPADITTGAVINTDGTLRHVPTRIEEIDGSYYAVINSLTNSTYVLIKNKVNFTDIDNHWAADIIKDMGDRKILEGVGEGRFAPDTNMTRAMFAAMTVRALGINEQDGENVFTDVTEKDWFYKVVGSANEYGLIGGYEDGTFLPNVNITREEAMIVIARAAKLIGLDTNYDISVLNSFSDWTQVSGWAQDAVSSCVGLGIVTGSSGKIHPKDMITRAEAVVMMMRVLRKANLI